jgi:glycosyltransferase involved in cell wall biosynthesis
MATELGLDEYEKKLYPNGARYVDTDRFAPEVPFNERERIVGYLGRLDEEKNIRTLAKAAKQLPEDVTFQFVGDGKLRGWLKSELDEEIECGSVETVGWVDHDEVPTELNRFRLLVLPSQPTEGLPTVILEAMACGTPVYATSVSGVPDVVREGETGFLMEDIESETIATEIGEILAEEHLNAVSQNARELINAEYNFEGAVERYTVILEEIFATIE